MMRLVFIAVTAATLLSGCSKDLSPARYDIIDLTDTTFERDRPLRIWLPPGYDESGHHYPVLYMFDGQAIFDQPSSSRDNGTWQAGITAERLIRAGKIEPIIIVGIDSNQGRNEEYIPYSLKGFPWAPERPRAHELPAFLEQDVIPLIEKTYRASPHRRGLGGTSFGGIATLTVARLRPDLFSRLLVESPSLWVENEKMLDDIRDAGVFPWPDKTYIGMGGRENSGNCDAEPNPRDESMFRQAKGLEVLMRKDGLTKDQMRVVLDECTKHSYSAWAVRFPEALMFLYGK